MNRQKIFAAAAVALAMGLFAGGAVQAAPGGKKVTIQINSSQSPGSVPVDGAYRLKELVEGKLGKDRVEIKVFPDGQLGSDTAILDGMRMGTHDCLIVATPITTVDPKFSLFDLPYLITSKKDFDLLTGGDIGKKLQKSIHEKGFTLVSYWPAGWRHVTNNTRPIVVPDDMKGMKIRVPSSPARVALFKMFGANPTPLAFGELFSALQQKVVDGQENPVFVLTASSLMEVQKYLSHTRHVITQYYVLFTNSAWDGYPEDLRQALREASAQVASESWDIDAKLSENTYKAIQGKMQVNEVDMDAFTKAAMPIYGNPDFIRPIGQELMDEALKTLGRK
ncbi:MAG: TRAP transporter substrate-binding protein [Candidatus Accumulibacter sp.]|jgi:tripartite ATP-independent transporter DctP family solute receptor|nr:TRAP transporter substrate-binding protein [Accumulibacter sp.]